MTRRLVLVTVLLAICLVAAGAPAQSRTPAAATLVRAAAAPAQEAAAPPPPPQLAAPGVPPLRLIVRFFELTEEQIELLKGFFEDQKEIVQPLMEQIAEKERELKEELSGETPAPELVGRLVIDIHALRAQIGEAHKALMENFVNILSEEQKNKLRAVHHAARLEPVVNAMQQLKLLPGPPR